MLERSERHLARDVRKAAKNAAIAAKAGLPFTVSDFVYGAVAEFWERCDLADPQIVGATVNKYVRWDGDQPFPISSSRHRHPAT
jgi:hypothetical protein